MDKLYPRDFFSRCSNADYLIRTGVHKEHLHPNNITLANNISIICSKEIKEIPKALHNIYLFNGY